MQLQYRKTHVAGAELRLIVLEAHPSWNGALAYYFGNKNLRSVYFIDDPTTLQRIKLDVSECERDLRVLVSSDLKSSKHVANIASQVNKELGMLV